MEVALILFNFSLHGYATARKNDEMKAGASFFMVVPLLSDLLIGRTSGYKNILNQRTSDFLLVFAVAIGLVSIFWSIGYLIGYMRE